jgi:hypothetical protein
MDIQQLHIDKCGGLRCRIINYATRVWRAWGECGLEGFEGLERLDMQTDAP